MRMSRIVLLLAVMLVFVSCQNTGAVKAPCNGYGNMFSSAQDCERMPF